MKKNMVRILSLILVAAFLFSGCEVVLETPTAQPAATVQAAPAATAEAAAQPEETAAPTIAEPEPSETIEYIEPEETEPEVTEPMPTEPEHGVVEDGEYTTKDAVSLYLHLFGHLPGNYITKKQAQGLGWENKKGNLWEVAPGKSIGGDYFGNYEGLLPKGHKYYECDIDFPGDYRNGKRIIFSADGLIYYTEDHYKSFVLLYGEES